MGHPPKLTDHQRKEAIRRREKGEETLAEIGRCYNRERVDDFEAADMSVIALHRIDSAQNMSGYDHSFTRGD